ncbi:hypothetical protein AXF42_Ash011583 [Apostasia shenzhenica]|uniref:Uncharacterized protein n=1 Tax=Apostasia shenzhenica TaxID=1088818 RepID=A0A2I0BB35_9ASPA|nr:hypothetical protein AXF42_Ash011583 [Apostasia shenzhenica]
MGFRVSGLSLQACGFWLRAWTFKFQGLGFGLGLWASGLGLRAYIFRLTSSGLGLYASCFGLHPLAFML